MGLVIMGVDCRLSKGCEPNAVGSTNHTERPPSRPDGAVSALTGGEAHGQMSTAGWPPPPDRRDRLRTAGRGGRRASADPDAAADLRTGPAGHDRDARDDRRDDPGQRPGRAP